MQTNSFNQQGLFSVKNNHSIHLPDSGINKNIYSSFNFAAFH